MTKRWLPALRQALETKSLTISGYNSGYGAVPRTHTYGLRDSAAGWDMDAVIQDGYERVVWVFKSVEVISGNASRLPFVIRDGEDELENHPLMRVLNKQANPLETGRAFRKRLSAQILLSKRGAFVEVTKTRGGQIARLDLLAPDRVRIIPDRAGEYVAYFEFTRPDGEVRNLSPERVRWIREPHPLDPFSGVTPLEAAGMSVELDRLARAYNVSFINRDGRPGGIVGIDTDGLADTELDRIAKLFKPGAQNAGSVTAIGTGKGGMNYIDTSARPRDMAYETTSIQAKKEILAAFGVPESLAGDASERTFDNAEQEEFNFWDKVMLGHLDLIAAAFDGDVDDELDCGFDTSTVEALELPHRRLRAEAREEVDKGLRSIKEYRKIAKLDVIDNPQSRALWISPAKAPIPGALGDEAALGLEDPTATAPNVEMGPDGFPLDPNAALSPDGALAPLSAQDTVAQALAQGATGEAPADVAPEGDASAAVAAARMDATEAPDSLSGAAEQAVDEARMEGKSLETTVVEPVVPHRYDPSDNDSSRVELAVAATIEATLNRQAAVVVARLESPKTRRGTAYWVDENVADERGGTDLIDTARVVDSARWVAETQESLRPMLYTAAQESAGGMFGAVAATGALLGPVVLGAVVRGRPADAAVATAEQVASYAAAAAAGPTLLALAVAHNAMQAWQEDRVADLDRIITELAEPNLPVVTESVRTLWAEKARRFAQSLAVTIAQTVVGGARESAVEQLVAQVAAPMVGSGEYLVEVPPQVLRTWCTRKDDGVRAAHVAADGQTVGVGEAFTVGGHELRFPSDPLAPPSVARWCRCWVKYEWSAGAKFTVQRNESPDAA